MLDGIINPEKSFLYWSDCMQLHLNEKREWTTFFVILNEEVEKVVVLMGTNLDEL